MAELQLVYSLNLPYKNKKTGNPFAMQGFHVGTNNVYVIQGPNTQHMSRHKIICGKAVYDGKMKLTETGHNQSCRWLSYEGKDYFLYNVKPTKVSTAARKFAIQVGFVPFVSGRTVSSYLNVKRITNICDKRVESTLSTNRKKLLIVAQKASGEVYLHFMDVKKTMDTLMHWNGKSLPLSAFKKTTYKLTKSQWITLLPNGSFQGCALTDSDSIIIVGGKSGQQPVIHKIRRVNGVWAVIGKHTLSITEEVEGIQIKGEYFCIGTASGKIYRLRKDVL